MLTDIDAKEVGPDIFVPLAGFAFGILYLTSSHGVSDLSTFDSDSKDSFDDVELKITKI